jgi:small GTP-binding protein
MVAIPPFTRLKQLSKLLYVPLQQATKNICKKHRKKLFCKFEGKWFQFKSVNDVIVPFTAAAEYAHRLNKVPTLLDIEPVLPLEQKRYPAVVLIGHFNHGKTTLLDSLGGTTLVDLEAHGITQVVRTKAVKLTEELTATLVDTPGQDIFYRMRNYGASVADIALLLVAANEGVCEQTKECIGIVENLQLPVVVCINKVDHPDVVLDPGRLALVREDIRQYVALEGAPVVEISAKLKTNFGALLDAIQKLILSLDNINMNTRSPPSVLTTAKPVRNGCHASGTVLNIWRDRHCGTVLHVILRSGSLREGAVFSAGGWCGAVRRITFEAGPRQEVASAGQGAKLTVVLFSEQEPRPLGDTVYFMERSAAEELADQRAMEHSFPSFLVESGDLERYGTPRLAGSVQNEIDSSGKKHDKDEALVEDEEVVEEEGEEEGRIAVVLKTDSGKTISLNCMLSSRNVCPQTSLWAR